MRGSVLVTGAQGFVGRYMTCELLRAGWRSVCGVGRSRCLKDAFTHEMILNGTKQPARLIPELLRVSADRRYQYRQGDITDLHFMMQVIAEFEPEIVIHLAATRREEPVESLIRGNVQGMSALVDACGSHGHRVSRIVLGSSGSVYGVPTELPLRECASCLPVDPYGASKLAAELFGRVLCDRAGIELVIGRIFNVIGPGEDERHVCGRLASQIAAISREEQVPVVSVRGLYATRDYVDVRDVAFAMALLAKSGRAGEIYNVGSGAETSVEELLDILIDLAGVRGRIQVEQRPGSGEGISRHFADNKKIDSLGPWKHCALQLSLEDMLSYYLNPYSGNEISQRRKEPT